MNPETPQERIRRRLLEALNMSPGSAEGARVEAAFKVVDELGPVPSRAPSTRSRRGHIQVVATSSPIAYLLPKLIKEIHARGFTCDVVLSKTLESWFRWHASKEQGNITCAYLESQEITHLWPNYRNADGVEHLEELTKCKVRCDVRPYVGATLPKRADFSIKPDAIVVFPATVDYLADVRLGKGHEFSRLVATDRDPSVPLVLVPYSNQNHLLSDASRENIEKLQSWGIKVLYGDEYLNYPPGTSTQEIKDVKVPCGRIVDEITRSIEAVRSPPVLGLEPVA